MNEEFIKVPWSADPVENRKSIEFAIFEAKRTGAKLVWEPRPYRLTAVKHEGCEFWRKEAEKELERFHIAFFMCIIFALAAIAERL